MKRLITCAIIVLSCLTFAAVGYGAGAMYNGYPVVNVVVNGQPVTSDVPAIVIDGRTLLPVRAIGNALNLETNYDPGTNTVHVTLNATNTPPDTRPEREGSDKPDSYSFDTDPPVDYYVRSNVVDVRDDGKFGFILRDNEHYIVFSAFYPKNAQWDGTKATLTIPGYEPIVVYKNQEYKQGCAGFQGYGRTYIRLSAVGLQPVFSGDTVTLQALD